MKTRGLSTPAELAAFADVGWSTAKQWLSGTMPRKRWIVALADHFCVNEKWLETGEGEPEDLPPMLAEEEAEYNKASPKDRAWQKFFVRQAKLLPAEKMIEALDTLKKEKPLDWEIVYDELFNHLKTVIRESNKKQK